MFVRKRWLAVLLSLLVFPAPARSQQATAPSAEELTLEQAIALALRENRQIKVDRLELDKFADRLAVAKTRRLPQINFSVLGAELLESINFDFKKQDLGILPGVGPDLEAQRRQRAVLDSQEAQLRADLNAKQAGLKVAETNLEYTRIVAPTDGNFTKIVQRIPVKIVLEPDLNIRERLRPGMSVITRVKTGSGRDKKAVPAGETR